MDFLALSSIFKDLMQTGQSLYQTDQTNKVAKDVQAQEGQLIQEANQQFKQSQEQDQLIAERTASEQSLSPSPTRFNAGGTVLTGPLGLPGLGQQSKQQLQLLGT